jgi:hypothetical protein
MDNHQTTAMNGRKEGKGYTNGARDQQRLCDQRASLIEVEGAQAGKSRKELWSQSAMGIAHLALGRDEKQRYRRRDESYWEKRPKVLVSYALRFEAERKSGLTQDQQLEWPAVWKSPIRSVIIE